MCQTYIFSVYVCVRACVSLCSTQQPQADPLELELQAVVVSCPMSVLGTKFQSSARAVSILTSEHAY